MSSDPTEKNEWITVDLCTDHFDRLAEGTTCEHCPSIFGNEKNLRLHKTSTQALTEDAAVVNLRRIISNQHHVLHRLELMNEKLVKDTEKLMILIVGIDGENGLRSKVSRLDKTVGQLQRWIWVATGAIIGLQALASALGSYTS